MTLSHLLAFLLGVVILTTPSLADNSKPLSSKHSPTKKPIPPKPLLRKPQTLRNPLPKKTPQTLLPPPADLTSSKTVKSSPTKILPLSPKPIKKPHAPVVQNPPPRLKIKKPTISPSSKTVKPQQHKPESLQSDHVKSPTKKPSSPKPVQKPPQKVKQSSPSPLKIVNPQKHKAPALQSDTHKSPHRKPQQPKLSTHKPPSPKNILKPLTLQSKTNPEAVQNHNPTVVKPTTKKSPTAENVKPPQHKPQSKKSPTLIPKVDKSAPLSKGKNPAGHAVLKKIEGLHLLLKKKLFQAS